MVYHQCVVYYIILPQRQHINIYSLHKQSQSYNIIQYRIITMGFSLVNVLTLVYFCQNYTVYTNKIYIIYISKEEEVRWSDIPKLFNLSYEQYELRKSKLYRSNICILCLFKTEGMPFSLKKVFKFNTTRKYLIFIYIIHVQLLH